MSSHRGKHASFHLDSPKNAERADIAHPIARILRARHLPIRIEVYGLEPLMHGATKPLKSTNCEFQVCL